MERSYVQPLFLNPDTGKGQSLDPSINTFLLKREDFETGTFADKPWIVHQAGNYNYSAIVTTAGKKAIRHMMNSNRTPALDPTYVDPVGGKPSNGLYTHRFAIDQFYSQEINKHIICHQWHRFDSSWWNTVSPTTPDGIITGKLFQESSDISPASDAWYLGLKDDGTIVVVSGNHTGAGNVWSHVLDGGWCNRSYGFRNPNGTPRNDITLITPARIFISNSIEVKLTIEYLFNPNNIGYHKARILVNDIICRTDNGLNMDANGYFNLPIECRPQGTRFINAPLDIQSPRDFTNYPANYTGYVGGLQVSKYEIWEVR